MTDLLWPRYDGPNDLAEIESVPLEERGLPASTYELLQRAAALWPDRTALVVLPTAARWEEPVSTTFGELRDEVDRVANALHALGVRRREAVALLAPNCHELVVATLAAQAAGIAAPINPGLSREHIAELLRRSGARVLVAAAPELDPAVWETAHSLLADGTVETLLLLTPTGSEPAASDGAGAGVHYLSRLAAQQASRFVGQRPAASDLAALFHTGGTTGLPKLAAHTHANEVADAWMIAANSLLDADAACFAALPLFHVNALVVTLLAPLFKGQTVVWAGPLGYREPELYGAFWKLVERHRIAAMSAVPTVYAVLAACPVDADISSLRVAMVGASPLPPAVRSDFEAATGVTLVEGYGLTEATCASARSFPEAPRAGSVGQRLPYQQVKAVRIDADGEWCDVPPGEVGVLAIKGPTIFPGYVVGRGAAGHELDGMGKLRDGWLDTGDLARVDEDGFVHLTGRAKDLIIRGGHNIDPTVIEDALLAHPDVTGALAVGRPDIHAGEVPVAFVTLAAAAAATEEDLKAWAAGRVVERAAAPRAVTVMNALPVTAVGKPYKLGLRALATRDEVEEALAELPGVESIEVDVVDGTVVTVVTVKAGCDEPVRAVLGRYAFGSRIEVLS